VRGRIVVGYRSTGRNWTLSVTDDGVGMSSGSKAKPGLGTGIVEALAKHLHAHVDISDLAPGTAITISGAGAVATEPTVATA
jgi:two-component sensor histidine kinase